MMILHASTPTGIIFGCLLDKLKHRLTRDEEIMQALLLCPPRTPIVKGLKVCSNPNRAIKRG